MMRAAVWITVGSMYGFGMFLAGSLFAQARQTERLVSEWLNGFRDGWEAAEQFDNDVQLVWGGNRD